MFINILGEATELLKNQPKKKKSINRLTPTVTSMFSDNSRQRFSHCIFFLVLLAPLVFMPLSGKAAPGEFDFGTRLSNGPNNPGYVSSIIVGDLDNDGDLDAIVGNGADKPNIVLLNDGDGQFIDSGQLLGNAGTLQMHLADFDGDSDLDLLTLNGSTQVQDSKIYINDGTGYFIASQQQFSSVYQPRAAVGDLDGDGDVDIIRGVASAFEVLVNDGDGGFTILNTYVGSGSYLYPSLGDMDGDGDLDLITNDRRSYLYFNDGVGGFSNRQELAFNGNSSGWPAVLGDVDGDGNLDIAAPRYGSSPSLFLGDGSGTFTDSGQSWQVENQYIRAIDFADVDADGDLDILFSGDQYDPEAEAWRWSGRLGVLVNDGTGQLLQSEREATDDLNGTYYTQFSAGDLDGDDDIDVLVRSSHGGAFAFFNNVQPAIPGDPVLISPSGETDEASPTFAWQADYQTDSFRVRIYDRALRAWVYDQRHEAADVCDASVCTVNPGVTLEFSRKHQWRVAAKNTAGWSGWSISLFDYLPDLPLQPTQLGPQGEITSNSPNFQWTADGNADEFRVRVYDRTQRTWVIDQRVSADDVCDEVICSVNPDLQLEYSRKHQWRVAAGNARGWTGWSVSLFNYLPDLPSQPILFGPQGEIATATPQYQWASDEDILEYRVRIYNRAQRTWVFDERLLVGDVCDSATCSINPDAQLDFSRKHQWRVAARNARGWSSWSFSIFDYLPAPPTPPVALGPLGAIGTTEPAFQWERDSNAVEFRFRLYDRTLRSWVVDQRFIADDVCDENICSVIPSVTLAASRNHQWRVATRNVSGWSNWTISVFHND